MFWLSSFQFESDLFKQLMNMSSSCQWFGGKVSVNIKISHVNINKPVKITETLPLVLLGLSTAVNDEMLCSPAEIMFGTKLRFLG